MIVFDIETAEDNMDESQVHWFIGKRRDKRLKDPVKLDADTEKITKNFPLSPLTGKIILIGLASETNVDGVMKQTTDGFYSIQLGLDGKTEKDILEIFWKIIASGVSQSQRVVSFNGKGFDMPFIIARSLILEVDRPNILRMVDGFLQKYNNSVHLDVFLALGGNGTQSEWANKMLEDEPLSSDGHLIPLWYKDGQFDEIIAKNYLDIKQLFILAKKMERWL